VEKLRLEMPALELELTVETTPVLMDMVGRGAVDLVFAALPASAEGVRNKALPPMDMVFVGNRRAQRKRLYSLTELAQYELLTFQRGSQPHVSLLDQLRHAGIEPKRVHAISSISAMLQLVQGGFGVATLPRATLHNVMRLATATEVKALACDTNLVPLPIHASYRGDPTVGMMDAVVRSALQFIGNKKKSMT